MNKIFLGCLVLLAGVGGVAQAAIDLTCDHGRVLENATVAGTTVATIEVHNAGAADDTLTKFDCPIADSTTLVGADGKPVTTLIVPAGQSVTMSQSGLHLVLKGIHYTVDSGSLVPCSFTFATAGEVGIFLNAVDKDGKESN
jgi:copper(I)-binding protein